MKNLNAHARRMSPLAAAIAASLATSYVTAQNEEIQEGLAQQMSQQMEEIFVQGRLLDGAESLIIERIEQPYSAEILGFDQIVKVGDPDIASALRRVTGLSLVDGKYIYVRGLGERYSSTTLNGAAVPSPELTRNVIPLDLFPTSILQSVKVYKSFSPDQPAAFGGGNIDIRTKGIPEDLVFDVAVGTGWNSRSNDSGYATLGDGGSLPAPIDNALDAYGGNVQPNNITDYIDTDGVFTPAELEEGRNINRQLLLSLNRNIEIEEDDLDPDINGSLALGNKWYINDDLSFGALLNLDQENQMRNEAQYEQSYANPEQDFRQIHKTIENTTFTGALNLGLNYLGKHDISTNSYLLENDEDQAAIVLEQNSDFLVSDGRQRQAYITRLEKRELEVNQIKGTHAFNDGDFGLEFLPSFIPELNFNWLYSDATATTEVPNSTAIQASNNLDTTNGGLISSVIDAGSSAQFNFLNLEDEVESGGFEFEAQIESGSTTGSIMAGYLENTKTREYYGYTANIESGTLSPRTGTPGQVFTDANLSDPNNGFILSVGSNFGTESYVAAQKVEAIYGGFDFTFNDKWRVSSGVRWEQFQQALLPIDLLDYSGDSINNLIEGLQDPNQKYAIMDDDYYGTLALTYIADGFLGTENFQLRFSYGNTVVRPDLREVADVQYLDTELNVRVQGNPNLEFSKIDHYDIRSEMYFGDGTNLTLSLFYKDIDKPIETVQRPGPQDAFLLSYENAESGEVYGIEFEGLKELGHGFFITGNVVLSDSELIFPENTSQSSQKRRLTGHSEYVVNAQLGYDSEDGKHSVSTAYNVFGERIYYGGLSPAPDAYEQPFHSLDLLYSFYPTDSTTLRLKLKNILDESQSYTQEGVNGGDVTIIDREIGTSFSLEFKYSF